MNDIYMSKTVPILDSEGNSSGWYKQIVSKVNAINGNIRLYPKNVYSIALDELKQKGFPNAGEYPHPPVFKDLSGNVKFKTTINNSAVKFRDAYIDSDNNVWAEFKTLDTEIGRQVKEFIDNGLPFGFSNRMVGDSVKRKINNLIVDVATELKLFSWDIVLNPAEGATFQNPIPITDDILEQIEGENMDFFSMTLEELLKWKEENPESEDLELCNKIIKLKEETQKASEKVSALNNELEKQQAVKFLEDELKGLNCNEAAKKIIRENGSKLAKKEDIKAFIDSQKAIIDTIAIDDKLSSLGYSKRAVITGSDNSEIPFIDNLMSEMDKALLKKDSNFRIDKDLRKANRAIIDEVMQYMKRNDNEGYKTFMKSLNDELITDDINSVSDSGKFAQSANISLAVLYQSWQDSKFLQLCLSEGFSGTTYKMPVEFQSHDLFNEDDFAVDELEDIPTEGVQTFLLEYGANWLKRGFIVTKEAEKELRSGPLRYDVIAANTASIANRFTRIIDRMISTEMLGRADEYEAKRVEDEVVKSTELEAITPGVNAPEETNAAFKVRLLCGGSSSVTPPIVRPRLSVWLDTKGRKQQDFINPIIVKDSSGNELTAGNWISSKGIIKDIKGKTADYAVDYENSCIYFVDGTITESDLPTISYSYATNIAFFNLAIPKALENFPARYYNKLIELIDTQKAYMGSAPRYVVPDFVIGSISAMLPIRQSELFYQRALPEGTSLLSGEGYFARRNGIDFGEHNATWAAGDGRLLLGKRNAVRVGIGSPYELEGPFPHMGKSGYTSAKEYFATQQIAINTPLVIDENGKQYNPPFRTIKYYSM